MEWLEPFDFPTGISGFSQVPGEFPAEPRNSRKRSDSVPKTVSLYNCTQHLPCLRATSQVSNKRVLHKNVLLSFQLVNVFKMLQSLHKKPKDASYSEPLPTDLWLRFQVR